jgi:spore maturation protein A
MCTFIVMNVSSLQLIPMTVIAYRSQFGAAIPSAIVLPGILATAVSTLAGLVVVKIMGRRP